jgi:RpiB/LacA/LacB family sugar-phosphate isomerase
MKTILFVCTGNICRSPMAEGLFRHATRGRMDCRVVSAGVGAMEGQAPSLHAIRALKELGIDISQQRSRMLTSDLVDHADYIFGMTHSHVDSVMLLFPQAAEKTFLLREFDETLDEFEKDISDPIGGSYETYAYTRDQIEQGILSMLSFIDQSEEEEGAPLPGSRTRLAIGCDHAGFELKEAIKSHLREAEISLADMGASSAEVSDYTDYARAVGEAVAAGRSDFGLLICATGIGMSMAANKIPGVRAALVLDGQMAAAARQHNNANVLCLGAGSTPPETAKKIIDIFLSAHYEGGRHERRITKMEPTSPPPVVALENGRSRDRASHFAGTAAPAGKHRTHRQRKFCQPRRDGGARVGPDQ